MKKISLSALTLTGALVLTLAACSSKEPQATSTPESSQTPAAVESVTPTETPEASQEPLPSESVNVIAPPAETDGVVKPLETQSPSEPTVAPSPSETPSEAPAEDSKVQAVWDAISTRELPYFMDLDDDILSQLYGIDAGDLVEYIGKMPFMNTQATEFFIAQVQSGKMDTVKQALEKRQADLEEQWSQYLPDQLELVKNYKLVTNGDYILFAIADCAEDAVNEFNTYTK